MHLHWKIFTESEKEKSVLKVAKWFHDEIGLEADNILIQPYHKGGVTYSFNTELPTTEWSDSVYFVLALGQRVARGWQIFSSIEEELVAWSNKPNISGATNVQISIDRTE
ncbi:hypothetical protein N480_00405 [Pseudoalteromonas luteoviolacea S2607]|uniref:hypothetical protein n=1 Tax=Pseudoalteromonas luteoviolacea TaxID=43657 RepID=UPI0007B06FC4|nr:hypothetical protein [Pseudoalteromonas luteoviolacea]KZN39322.1 hypothetical protein N480_00405 [Pseudoalteromonas luteoviolacea S2607]